MLDLPEFLDFARAKNEATALARRLSTRTRGWENLLGIAQALIARFQDIPDFDKSLPVDLLNYANAAPIVAAARILDTMAAFEFRESEEDRRDLSLQSIICYGMYGNFPAASAVAARANLIKHSTPCGLAVIGTCCPRLIGDCLLAAEGIKPVYQYLSLLNSIVHGQSASSTAIDQALADCLPLCQDPIEEAILLSARLPLRQVARLATLPALRNAGIDTHFALAIMASGVVTLLPPQRRAIEAGVVVSSDNAFISLPTSAGKTLLGELCMINSIAVDGGVTCFVAPYIAVARQVSAALRKHVNDDVTVCELFGTFSTGLTPRQLSAPRVALVATPERFDSLLRQGAFFVSRLRCVVVDEAHLVGNDQRGVRLGRVDKVDSLDATKRDSRLTYSEVSHDTRLDDG